jgi:hypothetical protein
MDNDFLELIKAKLTRAAGMMPQTTRDWLVGWVNAVMTHPDSANEKFNTPEEEENMVLAALQLFPQNILQQPGAKEEIREVVLKAVRRLAKPAIDIINDLPTAPEK